MKTTTTFETNFARGKKKKAGKKRGNANSPS